MGGLRSACARAASAGHAQVGVVEEAKFEWWRT